MHQIQISSVPVEQTREVLYYQLVLQYTVTIIIHTLLQNVVAAVEQMVSASMDSAGVHLDLLKLNVFVWQSAATHPHHPALDTAVCAVITDMDYL